MKDELASPQAAKGKEDGNVRQVKEFLCLCCIIGVCLLILCVIVGGNKCAVILLCLFTC